jgi:YHS domain-containing protein
MKKIKMFGKKDPVCQGKVKENTEYNIVYLGKTYYFDSKACMNTFNKEPERFVKRKASFLEKIMKPAYDVPKCH